MKFDDQNRYSGGRALLVRADDGVAVPLHTITGLGRQNSSGRGHMAAVCYGKAPGKAPPCPYTPGTPLIFLAELADLAELAELRSRRRA